MLIIPTSSLVWSCMQGRVMSARAKPAQSKEAYLLPPLSEFGDVLALPLVDMKPSLDLDKFLYFWKINFTK
jgi:hypothetical protein